MTKTLRSQAHGALAVLHHTSHQDKADILAAYVEALEAQSRIALDRAAMLHDWGWQLCRKRSSAALRLRHPHSFFEVDLQTNGDARLRLMRVKIPHEIAAEDTEEFKAYLQTLDRGDRRAIQVAKRCVLGAFAVLAAMAFFINRT